MQFFFLFVRFMPYLKFIIENSTNLRQLRLLRGKTIECVSLIGLAVGQEKVNCVPISEWTTLPSFYFISYGVILSSFYSS